MMRRWQLGILSAIILWVYWPTISHLVGQWWNDPNFSHGFFVPLFSAYVLWKDRDRLARIHLQPSWSGFVMVAVGMCILFVGQMGAELFLARFSLVITLAGIVVLFCGWNFFRSILFPWMFLLLMIPIPTILFNQITFPLQLLASHISAAVLPVFGVPILREGNVIHLPAMSLEVAEACSGIRSLMSLVTLAIIYGYLMEKRLWVRWVLAIASVPIAVAANSIRIIGTGLLVQYWDADKAEGYFHASWGWIIFVVSLLMLYGLHQIIGLIWKEKGGDVERQLTTATQPPKQNHTPARMTQFVAVTLLLVSAAVLLQIRRAHEVFPPRLALQSFPQHVDGWNSVDVPIDEETLKVLGPGDFLMRNYVHPAKDRPAINLFIAYFPSQRSGDTIHSPKNCLPGAGWSAVDSKQILFSTPGHDAFPVNVYVVAKGQDRQLVLYFYWAHGRGVASEYVAKYHLVVDAIKMNRSDGSLIRFITPMSPGESVEAATQRVLPFVIETVSQLQAYIPQ